MARLTGAATRPIPCATMSATTPTAAQVIGGAIQCNTVQYSVIQCQTVQYSAILSNIVQYSAILSNIVQYSAILSNIV